MKLSQLSKSEYPEYYQGYLKNIEPNSDLFEELEASHHYFIKFVQDIPLEKHDYRYDTGKWTIKEIIQHLIDSERIFAYRALRFSRNDKTELPGFDENNYVDYSNGNQRHLKDLLMEFSLVRHTTLALFKSFSEVAMNRNGIASGHKVSVRALGFIIIAHQEHHKKVFQERYLK
ncbi:MAG: DinB family protein [Flavobacteriaceae bacterium]